MLGKIMIAKMEILSALSYLAMILPAPSSFITMARREMFRFIWGGKTERVKRTIMYKPKALGGRDVLDITKKFKAMFLSNILKGIADQGGEALWTLFAKFWVGRYMPGKNWERRPLTLPSSDTRPYLYQEAKDFLVKHKGTICAGSELSSGAIHELLEDAPPRIETIRALTENQCVRVWKCTSFPFLFNKHKDVAWKVAQNCLPTRTVLYRWGLCASAKCIRESFCNEETIDHVFWDCTFAKLVWNVFRPWFGNYNMVLCRETVLFGLHMRKKGQEFCRLWAVINCVKCTLWVVRNKLFLKKEKITLGGAKSMALNSIKDYVTRDLLKYGKEKTKVMWKMDCMEHLFGWDLCF
ncbi:uncharacterized protein LOC121707282 [Alosa sapidissima]|uniref:uncharacterized protein LOC121707280 n=1 Tax=Alosa sapidissima TaxID=34773 RepID=UPI001C08A3CF|nr:uncharacterized protein LOC121707280 [Alosa sapidissima]XP_041945658.1 uncharacterized protein LOC121707282 [Alosa sapidissima]